MHSVFAVATKEMRQIARDRRTVMILAFVPAFFLLVFGYALNFDVKNIKLAVEDRDGTPESRSLVSAFVNSGYFNLAGAVYDPAAAERMLDRNDARAVLVIPEGFSETVTSYRSATTCMTDAKSRRRRTSEYATMLMSIPIATPTNSTPTKPCIGTEGEPRTRIAEKRSPRSSPLIAPVRAAAA